MHSPHLFWTRQINSLVDVARPAITFAFNHDLQPHPAFSMAPRYAFVDICKPPPTITACCKPLSGEQADGGQTSAPLSALTNSDQLARKREGPGALSPPPWPRWCFERRGTTGRFVAGGRTAEVKQVHPVNLLLPRPPKLPSARSATASLRKSARSRSRVARTNTG